MAPSDEIEHELLPFLRVYKDGRIERYIGTDVAPASFDPATGVTSKDIDIFPELGVTVRLYLPKLKLTDPTKKLPVLVYYHGGGFCVETAYSPQYHNYVNSLVSQANMVGVSVHYRRAPEHYVPACYDDSWAALQWVASHARGGGGTEPWLRHHADFTQIFLSGDSAGGSLCHDMAMRAADTELGYGVSIFGLILTHAWFWGADRIGNEAKNPNTVDFEDRLWKFVYPSLVTLDDPIINPLAPTSPSLSKLACKQVIVAVAAKDILRDRGWAYYHALCSSGWKGKVEIYETEDEDHVFHLKFPESVKAVKMMDRVVSFINM
ncbi:hypothetical protein ACLOJK_013657 [Asimina triloba]